MKLTFQARLTWSYGLLLATAGALMITVIMLALRLLPDYDFARTILVPPGGDVRPGNQLPLPDDGGLFAITSKDDLLRVVLGISVAALALVVGLGILAGRLIARRLLRPVSDLSHAATRAATGSLRHRINSTGPADELKELSDTFDGMLGTLQATFEAQQRFTANASHELLTPLAMNRTALQLIRDRPDQADLEELHAMLYETNERSIAITQSLLRLAQVHDRPPHDDAVDLTALTTRAVEAAAARDISVQVDAPAEVGYRGDAVLLSHLFANLVGNAVKYNTPGGSVRIVVRELDGGRIQWGISNTGPQVEAEQLNRLFEPFHRLAPRTGSAGYGLGLSVARAIVHAHGGTITAHANPGGGLTFDIRLYAESPGG